MYKKLNPVFNGEYDHVEVTNPDGQGQQAVIFVISDKFEGLPTVRRHMQINNLLKEEIKQVHAVSIDTKTLVQMVELESPVFPEQPEKK